METLQFKSKGRMRPRTLQFAQFVRARRLAIGLTGWTMEKLNPKLTRGFISRIESGLALPTMTDAFMEPYMDALNLITDEDLIEFRALAYAAAGRIPPEISMDPSGAEQIAADMKHIMRLVHHEHDRDREEADRDAESN